jgi:hypothetical protein
MRDGHDDSQGARASARDDLRELIIKCESIIRLCDNYDAHTYQGARYKNSGKIFKDVGQVGVR